MESCCNISGQCIKLTLFLFLGLQLVLATHIAFNLTGGFTKKLNIPKMSINTVRFFYFYNKYCCSSPGSTSGIFWPIQCAVTRIQKEVITFFRMGVAAHWMGKKIPELLPEEEETFLGQIKVPGCIYIFRSFNFSVKPPFKKATSRPLEGLKLSKIKALYSPPLVSGISFSYQILVLLYQALHKDLTSLRLRYWNIFPVIRTFNKSTQMSSLERKIVLVTWSSFCYRKFLLVQRIKMCLCYCF